ncbi:LOG family protein [Acinetobacter larvae]|uniref:Cytokinin riboside 5'-monophosphate phosphoribohydrolase n=1 Tax=Acinetobacter larvae TaxID=1789224 RepID=A0A1B2LWB6_9GAMM|nr:TIGR00730 family Rossman fold protein [Acinetobacter larvae]AOA57242.1 Rossman fold protein, TIGR00730 family [Acinetobacter larvae]
MNSIAVFCGSALGNEAVFAEQARLTGTLIAQQGKTLVYGGGRSGLMGIVADSALAAGGQVIGVIPQNLVDSELAHPNLTALHIVADMHERKTKMSELADAFIAMPGGSGTFEEIFEQWTWAQLGIHLKPCAFLNVEGFYDDLIKFIAHSAECGFTKTRFTEKLIYSDDIQKILAAFEHYIAPAPKWGAAERKAAV